MSIFSSDIKPDQAKAAVNALNKMYVEYGATATAPAGDVDSMLADLALVVPKEREKEFATYAGIVKKFNEQQQEAEDNLKTGLSAALSVLKRFLPKEIKAKIPADAIDLLFAFLHKPELLVDKMNHEWEGMVQIIGIPSEHMRIISHKKGVFGDCEAVIQVYNPAKEEWQYLEYNFREILTNLRSNTGTLNVKADIRRAYGLPTEIIELKTASTALNQNNG